MDKQFMDKQFMDKNLWINIFLKLLFATLVGCDACDTAHAW